MMQISIIITSVVVVNVIHTSASGML